MNLKNLKRLKILNSTETININPIGNLINLESLDLSNYNGTFYFDSGIFNNLSKLEDLAIVMDDELDLASLGSLFELKRLGIGSNDLIKNVSLLKAPELQELSIYPRAILEMDIWHEFDFNWLLNFTNLEEIYIDGRYINDVTPLLKLPNLKGLQLRGLADGNILLPLVDSNSLERIFVDEKYWSNFLLDIFKERGIKIWTDDK